MMRALCLLLAAWLLCSLAPQAGASELANKSANPANKRGSAAEAQAMVASAVAYLNKNGREKALAEFNRPQGPFRDRDLYLVVFDMQGMGLAHVNARLVGKPTGDIRDADGKQIFHAQRKLAQEQGRGWVDYKWPNPVSGKIEQKSTYLERAGELIIMCGIYK